MKVVGKTLHHCSLKFRAKLFFENPWSENYIVETFDQAWTCQWNRFSSINPKAKDHFNLWKKNPEMLRLSGVCDGQSIEVYLESHQKTWEPAQAKKILEKELAEFSGVLEIIWI